MEHVWVLVDASYKQYSYSAGLNLRIGVFLGAGLSVLLWHQERDGFGLLMRPAGALVATLCEIMDTLAE